MEGKLEIKRIWADTGSLEEFIAPASGYLIHLELEIGETGKQGADIFSFNICDEKGLINLGLNGDQHYRNNGILSLSGYNFILIKDYSYTRLMQYLDKIMKDIPENLPWKQKAMILGKYFYWEYRNETIAGLQ